MLLLLLCMTGCETQSPPFDPSTQSTELVLQKEGELERRLPFAEFAALEGTPSVLYQGPLFGEKRRYVGLNLEQLQHLAGADDSFKVLKLHCRDGFVSEVPVETLEQGQFLLAFRDVDAAPDAFLPYDKMTYLQTKPEELTRSIESGDIPDEEKEKLVKERDHLKTLARDMKNLKNQGPFYPIFLPHEALPTDQHWDSPFCVSKVEFAKGVTDRSRAVPEGLSDDEPSMRGSRLFEQYCAVCHAMNGVGGAVGPELNRPMSVVEYWNHEALRQLLKDPSKVRANSKMPPFHLKDPMIDDLLAYLTWMAENKQLED